MWEDEGQVWQAVLCPKNDAKTKLMLPTYAMELPPAKEIGVTARPSHQSKMLRSQHSQRASFLQEALLVLC